MQVLILLLLLGCLAIFWLQNPQTIALVLFGSLTPLQLSLASWILIAFLAGLVSSFLIQLLASGTSRVTSESKKPYQSPKVKDKTSSRPLRETAWDDEQIGDDWEIEKPPRPTTRPERPAVEEPRQPSVYSYTPPQPREEVVEVKKTQPIPPEEVIKPPRKDGDVYDANYRVLNPPNKTQPENPDEEDWI